MPVCIVWTLVANLIASNIRYPVEVYASFVQPNVGSASTYWVCLLYTSGNLRFSQSRDYVATFGGSETNVAVSLANFGIPTEFVTRLPDNDIARACISDLRSHGLRTYGIIYGGDRRGIYFLENGASFRNSKVVYDRCV